MNKRIVLLNTAICTGGEGKYVLKIASLEAIIKLWKRPGIEKLSAIGHQATADLLSTLLGEKISMNRVDYKQEKDDIAIVLKTKIRIPEGTVLTKIEEIEKVGYDFFIMGFQPLGCKED